MVIIIVKAIKSFIIIIKQNRGIQNGFIRPLGQQQPLDKEAVTVVLSLVPRALLGPVRDSVVGSEIVEYILLYYQPTPYGF